MIIVEFISFVEETRKIICSFSSQISVEDNVVSPLLKLCHQHICNGSSDTDVEEGLTICEAVIDRCWEHLNTGHWKQVPQTFKRIYSLASCIKAYGLLHTININDATCKSKLHVALKAVDMGLLLGSSCRKELHHIASRFCYFINAISKTPRLHSSNVSIEPVHISDEFRGKFIDALQCPSLEAFLIHHFRPRTPVKLMRCMGHWPAMSKWCDLNYLREKIGPRTIPIEIGSCYTSSNWSQKLMTFSDFLQSYVINKNGKGKLGRETGYLAQHELFEQIPELSDDIKQPEYCVLNEDNSTEADRFVNVNAWFGPANTVSPAHQDPKHNLLAQVVGAKRVFLIHPKWSKHLYPFDGDMLHNTARVDPENPDYTRFPSYKDVDVFECILNAGEILYIPPKWWHHVRSLSISFSVSFWWGKEETT